MDKNLKYALLDNLIENGNFCFDREKFFENNLDLDPEDYEYTTCEPIENYLENIVLEDSQLKSIDDFSWGASSEIISSIWQHYDGEDDYFNITSLEGIERCPNITEIFIVEYTWNIKDLSPLSALKELEKITASSAGIEIESLKPLLELPKLKEVRFEGLQFKNEDETKEVINELKERGVDIDIE